MALPIAIGELLSGSGAGKAVASHVKGLVKGPSFGSQLHKKLDAATDEGVLSQIAGMLQNGTPLTTVIDRVANALSNALTNATGNAGDATRQRTLERALAAALAPPGTSPPNQSSLQQAASLEQRLGNLLSKITGELKNAGQQNRFSGQVLDANSAKEIPAQQQMNTTAGTQPDGLLASAESILRGAVQQPSDQSAAQTASDVLGRMLGRAANADAQLNGQIAAPAAPVQNAGTGSTTGVSPSDLFARLMNVIAQASNEGASGQGGKQSQNFAFEKDAASVHHASPSSNTTQTPAFASVLPGASSGSPSAPAPAASAPVDPQAVLEQIVKGITMRNLGATSEVRMRLQPEHLGDVSLKLTVSGNTISANIVAQNADVRDLLMQNQQQLARTLSEAGLSLGAFSVDVSGGNPGFSQQQTQQQRSLSKVASAHLDAAGEEEPWTDSRFGPPLLSGAKSLVLNYLA